ncbi:hypothetical protein L1049_010218 [Liquidambar formosana]|uniref:Uncharacterized protein n=1 Tax=Liquidambar formosana TaxID=63359 RepID=A0AAP0N753_LIQFO
MYPAIMADHDARSLTGHFLKNQACSIYIPRLRIASNHCIPCNGASLRHFIKQNTSIIKRSNNISIEKGSTHIDMRIEADFEKMGMEMADNGEVMQMGTGFERVEYGETIQGDGLAVHLGAKV